MNARFGRLAAAWVAAALIGTHLLAAQGTTGKIEGTVHDQAGTPVVGAQLRIMGTAFTAVSNERGYYFVNNVPPGVYVVASQYIGFAPAEVRNVRVWADQTMTIDVPMVARTIEVSGVTVTVEQTPIVPRDQVTSKQIVQGSLVQALPLDDVAQILALQPGVVEGRTGQTIRGGRPGEAATYIDGVLVRNATGMNAWGWNLLTVGTNAVEEASVTTGAMGAEYGDAQSGVVNLVTRAGGRRVRGNLSLSSDDPAGNVYGTGLSRLEASLGGPTPVPGLTFFLATTLQGQQNARRSKGEEQNPWYVLDGVDTTVTVAMQPTDPFTDSSRVDLPRFVSYTNGSRRPMLWSSSHSLDGKLQYTFGSGSRLSFSYHYTGGVGLATGNTYNTMNNAANWNGSSAYILNWTQNLMQSRERALFVDATLSYQRDRTIHSSVDPQWATTHRTPFLWFSARQPAFLYDFDRWPLDDRLLLDVRLGNCQGSRDAQHPDLGACVPLLGRRDDFMPTATYRFSPYGVYAATTGLGIDYLELSRESRLTGRVNFDWQVNRASRLKFGGDFVRTDLLYYLGYATHTSGLEMYHEHPLRYGGFVADRIDLGDVVIDLGIRYDRLDSRILYPRLTGSTYTDSIRTGNLAFAYSAADTLMAGRCGALYSTVQAGTATLADSTAWSTCNFSRAAAQGALSPRLAVSFPVTDKTGIRLSYAHQLQTPSMYQLAEYVSTDFSQAGGVRGQPLAFGKTILFEFGIRHAFSRDMVLDVAAYNRDVSSNVAGRLVPVYVPRLAKVDGIAMYTNADFGNVRGVEVKLDRRLGQLFQGTVVYTYQASLTTGSDPWDYLNRMSVAFSSVTGEKLDPPQALLLSSENRYHTIAGNLSLNFPHGWRGGTVVGAVLQDAGLNATFRFASGLPYTPLPNVGLGTYGPGNGLPISYNGTEVLNSATMPWIRNVDLRVTRGFRFGGRYLTVFADFRNLFNWTNVSWIFAETGDVVNAKYKENWLSSYVSGVVSEAGALWQERAITKNGVTTTMFAMDLSNCSQYAPDKSYGIPNCLMLRRTEALFGNGDQVLDRSELDAAMGAYYDLYNGAWTNYGPGLNIRFGFELNF